MPGGTVPSQVAGDRVVDPSAPQVMEHILFNIRMMESGGNYTALNKTATASGAYQILDSVWRKWSKAVDGASSYPRAYQAPKTIQDAVAGIKVRGYLAAEANHLAAVPIGWYYPITLANGQLDFKPAGNPLTIRQYAVAWLHKYDSEGPFEGDVGVIIDASGKALPPSDGSGIPIIGGIIDAAGNIAGSAFGAIASPLDAWKAFLSLLTSGAMWMRVLKVIGGLVAIFTGVWIITHDASNMVPKLPNGASAIAAVA